VQCSVRGGGGGVNKAEQKTIVGDYANSVDERLENLVSAALH
jgi:hypothetical protein